MRLEGARDVFAAIEKLERVESCAGLSDKLPLRKSRVHTLDIVCQPLHELRREKQFQGLSHSASFVIRAIILHPISIGFIVIVLTRRFSWRKQRNRFPRVITLLRRISIWTTPRSPLSGTRRDLARRKSAATSDLTARSCTPSSRLAIRS